MNNFKYYTRKHYAELRPYILGEDITFKVYNNDIPKLGGMVARCYANHSNQWYVNEANFKDNLKKLNQHY